MSDLIDKHTNMDNDSENTYLSETLKGLNMSDQSSTESITAHLLVTLSTIT